MRYSDAQRMEQSEKEQRAEAIKARIRENLQASKDRRS